MAAVVPFTCQQTAQLLANFPVAAHYTKFVHSHIQSFDFNLSNHERLNRLFKMSRIALKLEMFAHSLIINEAAFKILKREYQNEGAMHGSFFDGFLCMVALCYFKQNEEKKLNKILKHIVELNQDIRITAIDVQAWALVLLGRMALQAKPPQPDVAMDYSQRLLALKPDIHLQAEAYINMILAQISLGNVAESQNYQIKAVHILQEPHPMLSMLKKTFF